MNKIEALIGLIDEARLNRITITSYKRFLRICKTLNLSQQEREDLEVKLEYRNGSTRELYLPFRPQKSATAE